MFTTCVNTCVDKCVSELLWCGNCTELCG